MRNLPGTYSYWGRCTRWSTDPTMSPRFSFWLLATMAWLRQYNGQLLPLLPRGPIRFYNRWWARFSSGKCIRPRWNTFGYFTTITVTSNLFRCRPDAYAIRCLTIKTKKKIILSFLFYLGQISKMRQILKMRQIEMNWWRENKASELMK